MLRLISALTGLFIAGNSEPRCSLRDISTLRNSRYEYSMNGDIGIIMDMRTGECWDERH